VGRPQVDIKPIQAERLKQVIRCEGLTQKALAEKILVSQQTVSKIINGSVTLTQGVAERIHDLFPCYGVGWLLGFEDYLDGAPEYVGYVKKEDAMKIIETACAMASDLVEALMKLCITMDHLKTWEAPK